MGQPAEKKETQERFNFLKAEAIRLSGVFDRLAVRLKSNPENTVFENQTVDAKSSHYSRELFNPTDIDAAKIAALADEIRAVLEKQADLLSQANTIGF